MRPSLIVHGGAWDIPDEALEACNAGCRRALAAGWSVLAGGYGSHLNLDGHVECDAIVMDGATLRAGAAATLRHVKNPIRAARAILEKCPHMMLVAEGAERFAKANGVELCKAEELVSEAELDAWMKCKQDEHAAEHHRGHEQGTVGAVAIDRDGRLFAATSTGGTCCKLPGRVGDSPLIGCGCYADAEAGGVSCTGYGEAIMRVVMAKSATDFLRAQNLAGGAASGSGLSGAMSAARKAVDLLAARTKASGGLILLDRDGLPGFAFNTPRMAYGFVEESGTFLTSVE
jgi:L-asparaginase / beta-aspartyl-peptidase